MELREDRTQLGTLLPNSTLGCLRLLLWKLGHGIMACECLCNKFMTFESIDRWDDQRTNRSIESMFPALIFGFLQLPECDIWGLSSFDWL